jgi:hypothetical protein
MIGYSITAPHGAWAHPNATKHFDGSNERGKLKHYLAGRVHAHLQIESGHVHAQTQGGHGGSIPIPK